MKKKWKNKIKFLGWIKFLNFKFEQKNSDLNFFFNYKIFLFSGQSPCNHTMWAFEMVPGIEMINAKLLIHEFNPATREECLLACLKNQKCRGAMFIGNRCALSTISRHSVRGNTEDYFSPNREMEFYENNCFAGKIFDKLKKKKTNKKKFKTLWMK